MGGVAVPSGVARSRAEGSERLRWAGLPATIVVIGFGVVTFLGVSVPAGTTCPLGSRGPWQCRDVWESVSLPWVLPAALVASAALLLPASTITARRGVGLSPWAWLGVAGFLVCLPVPMAVSAVQLGAELSGPRNVTITVLSGVAASLVVVQGAVVLAERAIPRTLWRASTTTALGGLLVLTLVASVTLAWETAQLRLLWVVPATAGVLLIATLRFWRGSVLVAQVVLGCVVALSFLYGAVMVFAIGLAVDTGDSDVPGMYGEYGGLPVSLAAIAVTGLITARSPRQRTSTETGQ